MPAEPIWPFDNSYARLPERFFARVRPTPVAQPGLVRLNEPLAEALGLEVAALRGKAGLAMFAGNRLPEGAEPIALAYAGHQFGQWVPQLGDGRAVLLGEVVDRDGRRRDIQLKGSGITPFSRGGDGRAPIGPVVREYLASEAMHALGIPTTRSLAAVTTGEPVLRERVEPGGILTRVAHSHVRVGTFEYFHWREDVDALRTLADYVIARHYPELADDARPHLALLKAVIDRTAELVAHWISVGFIHGVMNTDNTSLVGETLDYGPFGFLDAYHPRTCYSAIDIENRYAFDQQPRIAHWNLTRLAETLLPLLHEDEDEAVARAGEALNGFLPRFEACHHARLRAKLGLAESRRGDIDLAHELLDLMARQQADFTQVFRALSDERMDDPDEGRARRCFARPEALDGWRARWIQRLRQEGRPEPARQAAMRAVNPKFILRNHLAQWAVDAATERGDFGPMDQLLQVLTRPYDPQPEAEALAAPPRPEQQVYQTFCGT
ncbi:protein adenylyltransferase SelO [Alkalilimnicola ehrlichii]|uniref:protein adenylyltransferase SelO n=1 Tax=Alkalilimnicola ehrlichii TaxID=351052 RepID=UPI003BA2AFF2